MEDIIGKKFNKLTVLSFDHKDKKYNKYYRCLCDCGKETIIVGYHIKKGGVKSCGCLRDEKIKNVNKSHGLSSKPLYSIWLEIKQRCFNIKNKNYQDYGGRGVVVCDKWIKDFKTFYDWAISNGYKEGLTIDRINNDGNYEPDNCRWTDMKTQMNNTRRNKYITYNNNVKTVTQWARVFGYNEKKFSYKYRQLKSLDAVLEYFKNKGEKL